MIQIMRVSMSWIKMGPAPNPEVFGGVIWKNKGGRTALSSSASHHGHWRFRLYRDSKNS